MSITLQEMRILQIHRALLEGGGGESVRQVAKRVGMAHSYIWFILQSMETQGQIDRVEVTNGDRDCVVYYTRWTEEMYAEAVHAVMGRMF